MFHMQKTKYDWEYYLEKSDKASLSMPKGCFWPRGKMLGGSSSINAMMYVRGNRKDYDDWYNQGNPGWSYRQILKYYKKSEDNRMADEDEEARAFHGTGGPLKVDMFFSFDPIKDFLMEAVKEQGYNLIPDVNGEDQMGFTFMQATVDYGKRWSTAKAFLAPAKNRTNLHVIKDAQVTDVIINDKGVAQGVNMVVGGEKLKAFVRKEVVLSGGAIGSPHILMNSGIGPKDNLERVGVKVKKDLSVGKNLQDHAIVFVPLKLHKSYAQPLPESDFIDDIFMYLMTGVGSLSHMGTLDFTGFVHTQNKSSDFPDIQYHYLQYRMGEEKRLNFVLDKYGYDDRVRKSLLSAIEKTELLMVMVVLMKPKSKGRIELRSKDPLEKPIIYGNYLEEREDVETFIRGVNIVKRLANTKLAKMHEAEFLQVDLPGCAHIEFDKPGYWECYIRHMTSTVYHPTSSCKMGPDSDPEAVVDARLKVKGVKGLRVIDASIMPDIIRGNTNAPAIMIGEKGSDLIKEDWKDAHTEL